MSLITLPEHLLHHILLHLPCTTSFSQTHPTLHAAVKSAWTLILSHPPPITTNLRYLKLTTSALKPVTNTSYKNLNPLRSLTLPPLTSQHLHSTKTILSTTTPTTITLHPSPLTTSVIPYLSPKHLKALPYHPAFLSHSLTLLHALPLTSFHLTLPRRFLPHDELAALAKHARKNNVKYQLTIPSYDYPFHTPHTDAPMVGLTIGKVMMRHEALWSDLTAWEALERLSIWCAEAAALEKLFKLLKGRIRRVIIEERDSDFAGIGKGKGIAGNIRNSSKGGFWTHVKHVTSKFGEDIRVVDNGAGRGRDFVTLLLWQHFA